MTGPVRFDESLTRFTSLVQTVLGDDAFADGRAVRDAYGRLAFASSRPIDKRMAKRLQRLLIEELGQYASQPSVVLGPEDVGIETLLQAPTTWRLIELPGRQPIWVDIVDQRIIGQDWVLPPLEEPDPAPPRLVFASMKGGVGRTTALCIFAMHLAQQGLNVLVVDADLEAPGLGAFLLPPEERPQFGLLDYLVENGLGGWRTEDYDLFVAPSVLTDRTAGQGLVDVVPAIGRLTLLNPSDMLAKLSRAMLEDPSNGDRPRTLRVQLREFIDEMSKRKHYGAVLIDSRAGFSEASAGTLLGLGANILLFGVNQPQTFEDYRFMLAHLAHLPAPSRSELDWRRRLRFVHAKADPQGDDIRTFRDRLYEVVSEEFYEAEDNDQVFNYSVDDSNAPHTTLVINFDFPYMRFDPLQAPGQLKRETYQAAFSGFVAGATTLLHSKEST